MRFAWTMMLFLAALLACFTVVACSDGDDDNDNDDSDDDDDTNDNDDDDSSGDDDDDDDVNPFLDPTDPGPYPAGNTTFFFEDASRELSCGDGNRILMTEVWYPAADDADQLPENHVEDFFMGRLNEVEQALRDAGFDPEGEMLNLPTGSYRDAPLNPDAPPMPVLIFSHGFSSNRFQNYTMSAYLATHGYMVVSADHTCNAKVTLTPDGVVLFDPLNVPFTLPERKQDVSFLLDVITQQTPEMFAGRVDPAHIGFWGHSFGGITTSEQIKIDGRVTALAQLASFGVPDFTEPPAAHSIYFWGKQDKWMHPFEQFHDQYIDLMPTPKYELEFYDTGHFAFSDLCEFIPRLAETANGCITETRIDSPEEFTNPDHDVMHAVLNAYTTAFFGEAFFDLQELKDYLAVNQNPDMMEYFPEP